MFSHGGRKDLAEIEDIQPKHLSMKLRARMEDKEKELLSDKVLIISRLVALTITLRLIELF